MSIQIYGDERDYEPGGIYYNGPMPSSDDDEGDEDVEEILPRRRCDLGLANRLK